MNNQSIKEKTLRGVTWSAVDNISQYAITFIVGVILARLLSPDDYGLLGIVSIFTTICATFVGYGANAALIRKKDVTEDDYSTIFIINLLMNSILYILLFICAPVIAHFFEREELVLLIRVSCITLIINAFSLVQYTRLTKHIDFKTQTKVTLIASITSGIVGIAMALSGCGVWSLVSQGLALAIVKTVLYCYFNRWKPQLKFSKKSFNELFGFGWKIMLSSLLDSIWKELYQVVVAKFYSPASLGQYTKAKHFSQLLSSNLTNVIQRVSFPVMSEIQDNQNRLYFAYRKIIKTTMFVSTICMFFLGAISEPLLFCLIGPKWLEASEYLPLICISGSFFPLQAINLNLLQVKGRSDVFLRLEIIKKIITLIPLCVGMFIGIIPMLYINIGTSIINYFLNSSYSGKLIGYNSWMQIKDIAPSYGVAIVMFISIYFIKYLPISNWIILPLQICSGIVIFFVVNRILCLKEYHEIKNIINDYIIIKNNKKK